MLRQCWLLSWCNCLCLRVCVTVRVRSTREISHLLLPRDDMRICTVRVCLADEFGLLRLPKSVPAALLPVCADL